MKKLSVILCLLCLFCIFGCSNDVPLQPNTPNAPNAPDVPNVPNAPTTATLQIEVGKFTFNAELYNNETVTEFLSMMPLTIHMSELNGNEKYFYLSKNLTARPQNIGSITAGDLMLYNSNCLVLFYESFSTSFSYTKIGKIFNSTNLKKALGNDSVVVIFNKE